VQTLFVARKCGAFSLRIEGAIESAPKTKPRRTDAVELVLCKNRRSETSRQKISRRESDAARPRRRRNPQKAPPNEVRLAFTPTAILTATRRSKTTRR